MLKSNLRILVVFTFSVFAGCPPALAGNGPELSGQPYFALSGAVVSTDNSDIDSASGTTSSAFTTPGRQIKTNTGYGILVSGGWLLDNNWRGEIEFGQRQSGLEELSPGEINLVGDLSLTSFMFNVARDFRSQSWITPYLGLGVGAAYHKLEVDSVGGATPDFNIVDGTSFAYQALAGINLEVGENLDLLVGYRFTGTVDPDLKVINLHGVSMHQFEMGVKIYPEDWF